VPYGRQDLDLPQRRDRKPLALGLHAHFFERHALARRAVAADVNAAVGALADLLGARLVVELVGVLGDAGAPDGGEDGVVVELDLARG